MKQVIFSIVLFCSLNLIGQQTTHTHSEQCNHKGESKCYTTLLDMFSDGLQMNEAQAEKMIEEIIKLGKTRSKSKTDNDNTFYNGIFYYPDAPADAGMSAAEFEQAVKDTAEIAMNEYLSYLDIEINFKVNYIGPMQFFSPDDFANKVFALGATGQGDYGWVNEIRDSFHLTTVSFIFPFGYPVNSDGLQASGWSPVFPNSAQNHLFYNNALYPLVFLRGFRSTISHEFAHFCGVNHELSKGNLGGDPNGFAFFKAGEIATTNYYILISGLGINAPSSPNIVINGTTIGSSQENSLSVIEDEMTFTTKVYEETFVYAHDTLVDRGVTITLDVETNGTLSYEVLSGNLILNGNQITVNGDGEIVVNAIQSGTAYSVSDTVMINVNNVMQAPTAACQNVIASLSANGTTTITAMQIDNGSTDSDGNIVSMTVNGTNQLSFDCTQIGSQTVTLEVFDNDGLMGFCTATVDVIDDIFPSLTCIGDTSLQLAAGETTTLDVNDLISAVSDNCDFTVTSDQLNFSGDNPGTFAMNVGAIDDGQNETTCMINVIVSQTSTVFNITDDSRISVFPNPTTDWVNIKTDGSLEVLKIVFFDCAGRLIKSSDFTSQFSTADFPKGIYSLAIITSEDVFMTRLFKI